jgi:AraC-like DNA-binding protein
MPLLHTSPVRGPGRPVRLSCQDGPRDQWQIADAAAAPSLTRFVSGYTDYWERTASFTTRREMPGLQAVLIVNLGAPITIVSGDLQTLRLEPGDGFLTGIHDHHALSCSTGSQAGVHVWLTQRGFQTLAGSAVAAIANRAVTLRDLFGAAGAVLGRKLLDAPDCQARFTVLDDALLPWFVQGQAPRPEITWAWARIRQDPACRVAMLAQELGWSRKNFTAQFRAGCGVAPKVAARLARFERVLAACSHGQVDWSDLAQQAGYFDQPHLIRDFTAFAGMTPTEYARRLVPGAGLIEA